MSQPQYMDALALADEVRLGQCTVLRAVTAHEQSIEGALNDPRAEGITVYKLLGSQYRWGHDRVLKALHETNRLLWPLSTRPFPEGKRMRDLTEREKTALVRACTPKREAA